ncbi:MAG: hypothetical protein GXO10_01435 [Crenarchaeota archaeon]|nr:hypothetical protein [Thermoproteota archaeon]
MRKIFIIVLLLTAALTATSILALYLALSNGYEIAKIKGTVIPIKITGPGNVLKTNPCIVDLGNITGASIFRVVKYCNNTIIVKRAIVVSGLFNVSNVDKAFNRLILRIVLYRVINNTIAPVPPIPSCILIYIYPRPPFIRPGKTMINECVLFPGTYSMKVVVEGLTKNVSKPLSFSIEVTLKVSRELVHSE